MCKELVDMINSKSISINHFFTIDPFTNDKKYDKISGDLVFFKDLYLVSNKTYERLATLAKLTMDDSLNLLVITGYSGCGKTNFLRYCQSIIDGQVEIKNYNTIENELKYLYTLTDFSDTLTSGDPTFFDENFQDKIVNESEKLKKGFRESIVKIKETLYQVYFNSTEDEIRENIAIFLNKTLTGQTVYFDFDSDKQERNVPLELKLTRKIEEHLSCITQQNIDSLYHFYKYNESEFTKAFENRSNYFFSEAIQFINNNKNKKFENYKTNLLRVLDRLEIDQLLCVETFLKISQNIYYNVKGNVYYFIDNIDMISGSNNKILIETISKFWDFIKEIQSLMFVLRNDKNKFEENKPWIDEYDKFKYIFSMRETTAMHICDHLRDRIQSYSKHFDISMDTNKSFVFKIKIQHFKKINR